ncbi:hypothetical protein DPM19_14300 [Actinomadura craniellae]|uniref:Uncharacterized protein n=2 Tax=Actinomadura craniellae TaxID=2231787 RepID=A0A365H6Z3_9ACTN|nr:hypothetical protein DPM19_14300 [Actinomadura craniellae]
MPQAGPAPYPPLPSGTEPVLPTLPTVSPPAVAAPPVLPSGERHISTITPLDPGPDDRSFWMTVIATLVAGEAALLWLVASLSLRRNRIVGARPERFSRRRR